MLQVLFDTADLFRVNPSVFLGFESSSIDEYGIIAEA